MAGRYRRSQELLRRAEVVIPLGTQTFSKAAQQYPRGLAPHFLDRGQGGRVWDVDGNGYVDLVAALLPVVLGYRDADVDEAVRRQLDKGISFSLATELEIELAERLVEVIPCAEMVRFGKNGSDATAAAVRIARAATGRDHVGVCGYHGWQDWYIGATTRNKGVPAAVCALTHRLRYNDLSAVDALFAEHPGAVAAVILEPAGAEAPAPGYLQGLVARVRAEGAVLIFDEIITGFRYALGGAQAYFGVTPDLACFGKAMGNGLPIAAVVGRAALMRQLEDVFFSGTFGGEALSLAAAIAVIDKMRREPVIEALWHTGAILAATAQAAIVRHGLLEVVALKGLPPWMIIAFKDHPKARGPAIRTLFVREMLARGVLISGSHNVCYAHDQADLDHVAAAYDGALATLAEELATGALEERLGCPSIESVFRVR
ncbi:MAG: aminotransferase class III-fold pyridoxal phosphate-dependent enzyme [Alphaproteobacteria bacterium]|nr:aminotransferase class III-fold pyridoxal phosphate-dependent enzyme [Alphaproteobacteria bacterium]